MSWQIILALLALTAVAWWLWRLLDARAAELGPHSFEGAAPEPPATPEPPAGLAPRSGQAAAEAPGPTPPEERA